MKWAVLTDDVVKAIHAMHLEGRGLDTVAPLFGTSVRRAKALLKAAGLEIRERHPELRRPYLEGDICIIPLADGTNAICDAADFPIVGSRSWFRVALRYAGTSMGGRPVAMHRILCPTDNDVDHINGDGLDNRRANLRTATCAQNLQNRKISEGRQFKGICRSTTPRRAGFPFIASIRADGKNRRIGIYATADEAARAYDKAAREHFGEFARLNFPDEVAP